ncbi:isochorismate synthase [Actinomyces polynesiensis]|uniref:isochorismate synthase n=1 Tax=Actinomyces polynesiensis TaxID=1325934 RepID=UPI000A9D2191|nr:isochorismate synthase [Actinomyces polynesiensis]
MSTPPQAQPATPDLHVRVVALPGDHPAAGTALVDLLPSPAGPLAWLGDRVGMVGWGEALRIEVRGRHAIREAAREWDSARARAVVGAPEDAPVVPVALGSFGFAWETPGFLVVPSLLVLDDEGGRWIVSTAAGTEPPDPLEALEAGLRERGEHPVSAPRGLWTETGRMTQTQWMESVRRLVSRLRTGAASKVVMSRDMVVSAAEPIDERHLLVRLHGLYPTTWAYAVGGLVGASPEMLASMSAGTVFSRVLAGTAARGEGAELLSSMKDRTEHLLAVESVARALSPIADTLDVPTEPRVIDLPNVSHLATDVTATLGAANVLDVVAALHPTAAVCGTPTKLAFDLLESFESTRRGRYSGPVGWIDASGEGEFAIALRCGQVSDDRRSVRVFAGGGIMPDSVPEVELAETRAKMAPVLEALGV